MDAAARILHPVFDGIVKVDAFVRCVPEIMGTFYGSLLFTCHVVTFRMTRTLDAYDRYDLENPIFSSKNTQARRERSTDAPPTQNDPHQLRRLRRPTGPRRACARFRYCSEGEEGEYTLTAANNYADIVYSASKKLKITVAQNDTRGGHVLGEGDSTTPRTAVAAGVVSLRRRSRNDRGHERIARRVLGGAQFPHVNIEGC